MPELTALDNVALPLLLNGVKRKEAYQQAKTWLNKVELAGKADSMLWPSCRAGKCSGWRLPGPW